MGKVKNYRNKISAFISSENGQRFFNFAYSLGAAVVILGALFKILHLKGGNALLSIGMGTEVLMFVLTAFDRPSKEYKWEKVYPELNKEEEEHEKAEKATIDGEIIENEEDGLDETDAPHAGPQVIIAGGVVGGVPAGAMPYDGSVGAMPAGGVVGGGVAAGAVSGPVVAASYPVARPGDAATANEQYVDKVNSIAEEMERLRQTTAALNDVSETLLRSYQAITQHSAEIDQSSTGYVEQMQGLNRNISGLNTIYEIQLKSVSSQIDAIDRVNKGIKDIRDMYEKSASQSTRYCEETEKMARYMQQLNQVYEKMIHAMTINMYPGMAMPQQPVAPAPVSEPQAPIATDEQQATA